MVFESLIIRAIVVGVLCCFPRWQKVRPKTAPASMSRTPGRELEVTRESENFSSEYMRLMSLVRGSCYGYGRELQQIESSLQTSRECQVAASFLQLVLTDDDYLTSVDRKFENGKLGLLVSERAHVEKFLKDLWLDRSSRRNKDLLKSVYVVLYARIHTKIASEDLVVAGSGNAHVALLSPKHLEEKVWPKMSDYWLDGMQKQRNV
jgi:hypothetical protein